MIVIINSGGANLASIQFALQRLGVESIISHDISTIKQATKVILPGVGSAAAAMEQLQQFNLIDCIQQLTQPVLGICLGMQLLYEFSTEGQIPCLNIIPGKVQKLPANDALSIPHMGWNQLKILNTSPLIKDICEADHFYYVHSYYTPLNQYTIASSTHGENFTAIAQKDNFYATQFHPERSAKIGAQLLKNFLEL